jgi:hypothetical protein
LDQDRERRRSGNSAATRKAGFRVTCEKDFAFLFGSGGFGIGNDAAGALKPEDGEQKAKEQKAEQPSEEAPT